MSDELARRCSVSVNAVVRTLSSSPASIANLATRPRRIVVWRIVFAVCDRGSLATVKRDDSRQ
jgi:hypothetical protein